MVVLHVRSAAEPPFAASPSSPDAEEEMEFLYECAASAAVADVAAALAGLLSLCRRLRARRAAAAGELERALDEAEAYASKMQMYSPVQCCYAMLEADSICLYLQKLKTTEEQVQHNIFLSPCALREHIKNIEKKFATVLQESPEALHLRESSEVHKQANV